MENVQNKYLMLNFIFQIEHANIFTIPNAVSDSSFIAKDPSVLLSQ